MSKPDVVGILFIPLEASEGQPWWQLLIGLCTLGGTLGGANMGWQFMTTRTNTVGIALIGAIVGAIGGGILGYIVGFLLLFALAIGIVVGSCYIIYTIVTSSIS